MASNAILVAVVLALLGYEAFNVANAKPRLLEWQVPSLLCLLAGFGVVASACAWLLGLERSMMRPRLFGAVLVALSLLACWEVIDLVRRRARIGRAWPGLLTYFGMALFYSAQFLRGDNRKITGFAGVAVILATVVLSVWLFPRQPESQSAATEGKG